MEELNTATARNDRSNSNGNAQPTLSARETLGNISRGHGCPKRPLLALIRAIAIVPTYAPPCTRSSLRITNGFIDIFYGECRKFYFTDRLFCFLLFSKGAAERWKIWMTTYILRMFVIFSLMFHDSQSNLNIIYCFVVPVWKRVILEFINMSIKCIIWCVYCNHR